MPARVVAGPFSWAERLRVSTKTALIRGGVLLCAVIALGGIKIGALNPTTRAFLVVPATLAAVALALLPVWTCPVCHTRLYAQSASGSACPLCREPFDGAPLPPEARVFQAFVARQLLRPDEGKEVRELPPERMRLRQRALHDVAAAEELARVSQADLDAARSRLNELEPRSRTEVDAALAAVDLRTRAGLLEGDLAAARAALNRRS